MTVKFCNTQEFSEELATLTAGVGMLPAVMRD